MSKKSKKLTDLNQIGEFGLIDIITQDFEMVNESTELSIGADAAILNYTNQKSIVSTDMLIEGVHFDLSYFPLKHLGYKAVVSSISDICAMFGITKQITVSIAVSNRFKLESIQELYSGIKLACQRYSIDLIGGDTTSSQKGLIISVTAIGCPTQLGYVTRSGSKTNDLLVVTGSLGAAYLGLQILEREKQVFLVNPENKQYLHLIQ